MGKYIPNLYGRDKDTFNAFKNCGHLTAQQLKQKCDISPTRLKNYIREGYVEKVSYMVKGQTKNSISYKTTAYGREVAGKEFGLKNFYHAQSPQHDVAVATKYFSLNEKERESVKNEQEIRIEIESKIQQLMEYERERAEEYKEMLQEGLISVPDFMYTSKEGIEIAYEVITDSYGKAQIEAKERACEILEVQLEQKKI